MASRVLGSLGCNWLGNDSFGVGCDPGSETNRYLVLLLSLDCDARAAGIGTGLFNIGVVGSIANAYC